MSSSTNDTTATSRRRQYRPWTRADQRKPLRAIRPELIQVDQLPPPSSKLSSASVEQLGPTEADNG